MVGTSILTCFAENFVVILLATSQPAKRTKNLPKWQSPEHHTFRVGDNYGQEMLLDSFPVPMNKHLRTGAEKENPTVPIKQSPV